MDFMNEFPNSLQSYGKHDFSSGLATHSRHSDGVLNQRYSPSSSALELSPSHSMTNIESPYFLHSQARGVVDRAPHPLPITRSSTLFVGDLPFLANEATLYDFFHVYGEIEKIQLKKNEQDAQKNHLAYGFIKFRDHESAARAFQGANGRFFLGRNLRVGWAEDHPKRTNVPENLLKMTGGVVAVADNRPPTKSLTATAQVHVTFATRDLRFPVSELTLRDVFVRYGNVIDITIKKSVINQEQQVHSGYGFIHFRMNDDGIRSALTAIEFVNKKTINSVYYDCTTSHGLKTYLLSLTHTARNRLNFPAENAFATYGSDEQKSSALTVSGLSNPRSFTSFQAETQRFPSYPQAVASQQIENYLQSSMTKVNPVGLRHDSFMSSLSSSVENVSPPNSTIYANQFNHSNAIIDSRSVSSESHHPQPFSSLH